MRFEDIIQEKLTAIRGYLLQTYQLDCPPHVIWFDDTDVLMVTITVQGVHARAKVRDYAGGLSNGTTTEQVCKQLRGMLSNNLYLQWRKSIYTAEALASLPN